MSQPGYPGGPFPPDNNPQQPGWGAGAPNNQPPPDPYGQPQPMGGFGEQPPQQGGYGEPPQGGQPPQGGFGGPPTSGVPGVPPTSGPGGGFGEQPTSGPGFAGPPPGPYPPEQQPPLGEGPQHTMALPAMGPGGPGGMPPENRFAPAPSERKKGPWLPVLAAVAAVFLILSATMTVLYVSKNGDYNQQKKLAASRQETIDTLNTKADKLNKELASVKKQRDDAKSDLSDAKDKNADVTKERDTIGKCLTLLEDALSAAAKNDDKKVNKLLKQLQDPCNKADAYLGN
jgi:hypothetical protein